MELQEQHQQPSSSSTTNEGSSSSTFRGPPKLVWMSMTAIALGMLAFNEVITVESTTLQLKKLLGSSSSGDVDYEQKYSHEYYVPLISSMEDEQQQLGGYRDVYISSNDNNNDNNDELPPQQPTATTTTSLKAAAWTGSASNTHILARNQSDLQTQISYGIIPKSTSVTDIHTAIQQRINSSYNTYLYDNLPYSSPACYPHFNLYRSPNNNNNGQQGGLWTNTTKFKRILFYHARKAGGSSVNKYLVKVAKHYNIKIEWIEWSTMEEPGTYYHDGTDMNDDGSTFYVTHLREPIDRSISHFKYNGRWKCKDLSSNGFKPTLDNAAHLETWNETSGHKPIECRTNRNNVQFKNGDCAVDCYTQWFGGLSCPQWDVPIEQQYRVAMSKLLKYNMIIVIEKLKDPRYVEAIENYFGVKGILERGTPYCERKSHKANYAMPLVVKNETREKLTELNKVDLRLYHEITDCLNTNDDGGDDNRYESIPKWDGSRFELDSFNFTKAKLNAQRAKAEKLREKTVKEIHPQE